MLVDTKNIISIFNMTKQADAKLNIYILITIVKFSNQRQVLTIDKAVIKS